jgi:hypothetical protein
MGLRVGVLGVLAFGAVSCGPPGPGNFEGSFHGTRVISPGGNAETDIAIVGTEMDTADMLVDVGSLGADAHCVVAFVRMGDTGTARAGQTCAGRSFIGFVATLTSGTATASQTGSTRSVSITLNGTYNPDLGSGGPFTLTFTGSRQ